MAKKSAKSKGYRNYEKKKPFLTKNELIALIIILVVVIAAFAFINWLPTRGYVRAGKVQSGDITAYASTDMKDYYLKMGTVNEYEGYTMEVTEGGGANVTYKFYPDEESDIEYFSVSGAVADAELLVSSVRNMESETLPFYDTVETEINGMKAYVYAYSSSSYVAPEGEEETEDEDQEPNTFYQSVGAYLSYDEGHSIAMHVALEGDSEDVFVSEEDMVDFIAPFADAFSVNIED